MATAIWPGCGRLATHRRGDAGGAPETIGVGERQGSDRAHHLRPVEEGEPLFGLQLERLDARDAERLPGSHGTAGDLDAAPPRQRQRQMGQWREIARRSHGTLGRHDRVNAAPEQVADTVHQHRPAARMAQRQRVCSQQEHGPHHVPWQRLADPYRV
jgi:hypothetical protein